MCRNQSEDLRSLCNWTDWKRMEWHHWMMPCAHIHLNLSLHHTLSGSSLQTCWPRLTLPAPLNSRWHSSELDWTLQASLLLQGGGPWRINRLICTVLGILFVVWVDCRTASSIYYKVWQPFNMISQCSLKENKSVGKQLPKVGNGHLKYVFVVERGLKECCTYAQGTMGGIE